MQCNVSDSQNLQNFEIRVVFYLSVPLINQCEWYFCPVTVADRLKVIM